MMPIPALVGKTILLSPPLAMRVESVRKMTEIKAEQDFSPATFENLPGP
jgi:hypothetical protein